MRGNKKFIKKGGKNPPLPKPPLRSLLPQASTSRADCYIILAGWEVLGPYRE